MPTGHPAGPRPRCRLARPPTGPRTVANRPRPPNWPRPPTGHAPTPLAGPPKPAAPPCRLATPAQPSRLPLPTSHTRPTGPRAYATGQARASVTTGHTRPNLTRSHLAPGRMLPTRAAHSAPSAARSAACSRRPLALPAGRPCSSVGCPFSLSNPPIHRTPGSFGLRGRFRGPLVGTHVPRAGWRGAASTKAEALRRPTTFSTSRQPSMVCFAPRNRRPPDDLHRPGSDLQPGHAPEVPIAQHNLADLGAGGRRVGPRKGPPVALCNSMWGGGGRVPLTCKD
jgi:hypothetical protein